MRTLHRMILCPAALALAAQSVPAAAEQKGSRPIGASEQKQTIEGSARSPVRKVAPSTEIDAALRSIRRARQLAAGAKRYPQLAAEYGEFASQASRLETNLQELRRLEAQKVPPGDKRYRAIDRQLHSQAAQLRTLAPRLGAASVAWKASESDPHRSADEAQIRRMRKEIVEADVESVIEDLKKTVDEHREMVKKALQVLLENAEMATQASGRLAQ